MKIAVIGSGVSGLAATWLLNEYSDHEVHLYEADSRPGGHAHTVALQANKDAPSVDVDTGFIVFNPSTYPNFLRFLHLYPILKNAIQPTSMTFSVSRNFGAFEWAGNEHGLRAFFTSWRRVLDGRMWRLAYDILRFNACARRLVMRVGGKGGDDEGELSIGEYLKREGYSDTFRDDYLIPMTSAIWSTPPDKCALDFPAKTLIRFMHNHHLLQITGKPDWLTLRRGSKVYVNKIISALPPGHLHLNTPIKSVSTTTLSSALSSFSTVTQVQLETTTGEISTFDHVILACHADETLRILTAGHGGGDEEREREKDVLGAFGWNRNEVVLHSDVRLMPRDRMTWSCWNYLIDSDELSREENGERKGGGDKVALTYWMNALQHIPMNTYGPVLVTLNPHHPFEPRPETVVGRWKYDHPVLDAKAIRAQNLLPTIQAKRGISYAGAYLRYGFHEDGFTSGLRAVMGIPGINLSGTRSETAIMNDGEAANTKDTKDGEGEGGLRMPFEVLYAESEPEEVWIEKVFVVLEGYGVRKICGWAGDGVLFVVWIVWVLVRGMV